MMRKNVNTMKASLLLIGTIIGAGIFAVPSMIGAWGIIPSTFAFILLTAVMTTVHLYYGEAILRGKKKGHLIGRATYWLGPWAGHAAGAIQSLQIFGSSLAYLILGGVFLSWLGSSLSIPLLGWQLIFWVMGAMIVLFGLKAVSKAETVLTWILIGVIVFLVVVLSSRTNGELFLVLPTTWNGFEPYGVFLFSLLGIVGMSEASEIVEHDSDSLRKAVILSTCGAGVLTYLYGITAWAASNGQLTRDASDIIHYLPALLMFVVPLFGFLAVITSFISSALDLRNLLQEDAHASPMAAWLIALGVPLALLFVTPRDFMTTVGFVGSFFGAGIAVMAVWMGRAAIRSSQRKGKNGTLLFQTEIIPWLLTALFTASGVLWLLFPSTL